VKFSQQRIVRFGECDPAGVVYYPVFFHWFHELMECWFERHLGRSYAECVQTIGFPAKETKAEFFRPCALGEELCLTMYLRRLSARSMTIAISIEGSGSIKAKGHVVCVCIGVQATGFQFSSQEIPQDLFQKMEKFLHPEDST